MRNPLSSLPWLSARAVPTLAHREVTTLPPPAKVCACGAELDMEMERDEGRCVNCAFAAAEAAYRGRR